MSAQRQRPDGGFTIIEVLIAMSILAFIVAAIYSSWTAVLRSTKVGMDAAAQAQRTRIAAQAVEQALKTAVMFGQNIRYYSFVADSSGDFTSLSMTSRLPESFPGSGLYDNQTALRRVSFEVVPGTNGGFNLMLNQIPYLQSTNENSKPYEIVLARNVSLFLFEFWDPQQGWVEEYTYTNQLPKMVRFSIGTGRAGFGLRDPAELVVRTVSLPAAVVSADMQQPLPIGPGGLQRGATNRPGQINLNPGNPMSPIQPTGPIPIRPGTPRRITLPGR